MSNGAVDAIIAIGDFSLDLGRAMLLRREDAIHLRPKAFALLTHLARNPGRVIPKDELLDAVWPGVHVTEDSLIQSIRELRKILGDAVIRTVPKRGYILAGRPEAPVENRMPMVAVIRFSADEDRDGQLLADGIAEDILHGISRFGTFTVLARSSGFHFSSYDLDAAAAVRQRTGADYLVEGSVRRRGEQLTLSVGLVETATSSQIWGTRLTLRADDVVGAEQAIVDDLVGRLAVRVNDAGLQGAARKPETTLAAYELVLRGVSHLRDPARTDLSAARSAFEEAIARDPGYGLAHTYLGLSIALESEFADAGSDILDEARDHAERGIALAAHQATGYRVMSLVRLYMRDFEAAEQNLRLALSLNPSDPECVGQMGHILLMRGRPLEAVDWLDRAIRGDPLFPQWYQFDRSLAHFLLGDYRTAAEALETASKPTPWIRTRLAACYVGLGRLSDARRQAALARSEDPGFSPLDYVRTGIRFEQSADTDHLAKAVAEAFS